MNDELDREFSHLFDAARRVTDATHADQVRIQKALSAKVAAGFELTSASAKSASVVASGAAGTMVGTGLKLVLLTQLLPSFVAGALLGGAAGWLMASATSKSDVAPVDSAAPEVPGQPAAVPVPSHARANRSAGSELQPTVARAASTASKSRPLRSPDRAQCGNAGCENDPAIAAFADAEPPSATSELGKELALVSRMHKSWQNGDWAAVENAIRAHERQYPRGTLTEERRAVQVMLACRKADAVQARALALDFTSKHPGSTHTGRVSSACGVKR